MENSPQNIRGYTDIFFTVQPELTMAETVFATGQRSLVSVYVNHI